MSNFLKFTIETESDNGDVLGLIFLNEKQISVEISEIAKKLKNVNPDLFNKINNMTEIKRARIIKRQIFSLSEYESGNLRVAKPFARNYKDVEVAKVLFEGNSLKRQARLRTQTEKEIDFFYESLAISSTLSNINYEKLTMDDVNNGKILSEVSQLPIDLGPGIKTFLFKDSDVSESSKAVSYTIEISANTFFKNYVDLLLKNVDSSILFLEKYLFQTSIQKNFNFSSNTFSEDFSKRIFNQISSGSSRRIDLATSSAKNSEFGKASTAYYNMMISLQRNVDLELYSETMRKLLPFSNNSPDSIKTMVKKFKDLRESFVSFYDLKPSKINDFSKIHENKKDLFKIISQKSNIWKISNIKIGYNLISENQSGIVRVTKDGYMNRLLAEQAKFYPNLDIEDESSFLLKREKADFYDLSNRASFLTPTSLIFDKKRIKTNRGVNNMNSDDVKMFRLAKSYVATQFPTNISKNLITNDSLTRFNFMISDPVKPLLEKNIDGDTSNLIDSKYYIGDNSLFLSKDMKFIKDKLNTKLNNDEKKVLEIVSSVLPKKILKKKISAKSIKELQISNKDSKIRKLIDDGGISFSSIPPQIKSMMSKKFQASKSDPLKNDIIAPIIQETQSNIFIIKALVGFEYQDNVPNLSMPIYKAISEDMLEQKPMIAKAYDYEMPELGIVKDKYMATIYNNLIILGV